MGEPCGSVRVRADTAEAGRQCDDATVDVIRVGAQSIRPRIEQWDAHGLGIGQVRLEAAALAEELEIAIGERRADHAGAGDERRRHRGLGVAQDDGVEFGHRFLQRQWANGSC